MKKLEEELLIRVDSIIEIGRNAINNAYDVVGYEFVKQAEYGAFRSSALSFLENLFGFNHPFYSDFNTHVTSNERYRIEMGVGILNGVKNEINNGYLVRYRKIVSAEVFSDFFEMSDYLLNEGYKDASAVMIGSLLESHLKNLCKINGIDLCVEKDGKSIPKKVNTLNAELTKMDVYNLLQQKSITAWMDLRNKAAHGDYTEYSLEQVKLMYSGVMDFINR